MNVDLSAAASFLATHARVLDRRRFQLLTGESDPTAALAALDGYRNPDGGYGWGLEPDLRSPESQPGAALHAFEVFEDVSPATAARAVELCDWLESVSLPDGGLPFALPLTVRAGTAPWWAEADLTASSLQITAVTAAAAHRVAAHDPAVAAHPWLARATRYCLAAVEAIEKTPHAYVLAFAVRFLDAVHDTHPEAPDLLRRLGGHIPADGLMHVEGGTEEEMLRPLDFAPFPDRPARSLFTEEAITADLDRLAGLQEDDGGWTVDYARISPAGVLDWRGHATVRAVDVLRRNARI
ncbi:hypothetical protein [Streptosporangium carneum]|uniref:Prenyltransferase n=1 Tax=Streptosporangium carneum TaxID=47481 RepID=A0A9W6I5B5_9ACTN|nr:hypothetical protein [Streptosporangium carneum]GLK11225.1 hypothetical protein GCM10017600_46310 [Streptosporangium carneum]